MIPRSRVIQTPRPTQLDVQRLVESRINEGMITAIDPADIPNGAFKLAKNAVIRFDKTLRRAGSYLLVPEKPNSQPVIRIAFIKTKDGAPYTLRFTPSTIHIHGEDNWLPIVISPALTGTINDRFSTADILDNFVFANNGADPLQKIDFFTGTCAPLGNAPNYRYVVGFFNRAVGLARKDANEVEVGWSADGDPTEWNPATDPSAGSSPILESPADLSDFITGGLSFSNVMVVMREKSVWLATKQPIQSNPFYFYSAIPGIGMNVPYSLQLINNGLAWLDTRTKDVWAYSPNGVPERLSAKIKQNLFNDLKDVDNKTVFSSFSTIPSEYTIYIPSSGNVVKAYTYNFEYQKWTYNEFYGVTTAENVEIAVSFTSIDELVGTIEDLPGTIDSLSKPLSIALPFSYGRNDGSIIIEDDTKDTDGAHTDFPSGISFPTELESKTFILPEYVLNVARINIEYVASRTTTLNLFYSKDDGINWIHAKSVPITKFDVPVLLTLRKIIRARRFSWKIVFSASDVAITSYEIYVTPSGDSFQGI